MFSTIIGIALLVVSLAGIGFLLFFFVRAVAEEHAFNKRTKQLRRKFYGDDQFYGNGDRFN